MTRIPLPIARADLELAPLHMRGERYWTVKDPLAQRYFLLREEEYFVFDALRGAPSYEQVIRKFEARFAPQRLRASDLAGFLGMLHREGLTIAATAGQGEILLASRARRRRERWWSILANPLAIRLPGINPNAWLARVVPHLGWLFSWPCAVLYVLLVMSALVLAFVQFDALAARLPSLATFFGGNNFVWLALALAFVKSAHELGHAIACKHFGGECNRLGVILLLGAPALYCDVSDAWLLGQRWKRIAISAAGVIVELGLAAAAAWCWAITHPGLLHSLCLNIMVVGSLSTLVINGNPLLRFDGYYVLSDWLGIPNLQQQAFDAWYRLASQHVLGVPGEGRRLSPRAPAWILLSYGAASLAYRVVVIAGVLWLAYAVLHPRGLGAIALLLAVVTVTAMLMGPALRGIRFLSHPTRRTMIHRPRLLAATLSAGALLGFVLLVPLPQRVAAVAAIRPQGAVPVYVTAPGVIVHAVEPAATVAAGATLAELHNPELEAETLRLQTLVNVQQAQLASLRVLQHDQPALGGQLTSASAALAGLQQQLATASARQRELTLTAPVAGVVIPPRRQAAAASEDELELDAAAAPLEVANRGAFLETGRLLCHVGDPQRVEAVAWIDEADATLVQLGQPVRLRFAESPGQTIRGTIKHIARRTTRELPPELLASGDIPLTQNPGQPARPLRAYYEAQIELDHPASVLRLNAPGAARIHVPPASLGERLLRTWRRTFRRL